MVHFGTKIVKVIFYRFNYSGYNLRLLPSSILYLNCLISFCSRLVRQHSRQLISQVFQVTYCFVIGWPWKINSQRCEIGGQRHVTEKPFYSWSNSGACFIISVPVFLVTEVLRVRLTETISYAREKDTGILLLSRLCLKQVAGFYQPDMVMFKKRPRIL